MPATPDSDRECRTQQLRELSDETQRLVRESREELQRWRENSQRVAQVIEHARAELELAKRDAARWKSAAP